jgi:D-serine deaminase-like pyridoxal phosphate-dependent protein
MPARQVMSVSPARCHAVVDAGLKAVALDSGPPLLDESWAIYPAPPPPQAQAQTTMQQAQTQASGERRPGGGGGGAQQHAGLRADYKCAGDEHGLLLFPLPGAVPSLGPAAGAALPPRGALLRLQPGHCDPTVNLYDWIVAARGGRVEAVWRVAARGPGS